MKRLNKYSVLVQEVIAHFVSDRDKLAEHQQWHLAHQDSYRLRAHRISISVSSTPSASYVTVSLSEQFNITVSDSLSSPPSSAVAAGPWRQQ